MHTVLSMWINMQDTNQTGVRQQKASFKGGRIMFSLIFCYKNDIKMVSLKFKKIWLMYLQGVPVSQQLRMYLKLLFNKNTGNEQ